MIFEFVFFSFLYQKQNYLTLKISTRINKLKKYKIYKMALITLKKKLYIKI